MPEKELNRAAAHSLESDLMLVLVSSLVVNPSAGLVGLAIEEGARVILINQGETPYDEIVALRVWAGIGEVIPPAIEQAKQMLA